MTWSRAVVSTYDARRGVRPSTSGGIGGAFNDGEQWLRREPEAQVGRQSTSDEHPARAPGDQDAPAFGPPSAPFHEAPVAIYTIDLDGVVLSWNRAAEELFGWSADEVIGRPVPFIPRDEATRTADARQRLMDGEPISAVEYCPVTRDGTQRRVLTSASLVRDASGRPTSVIGFALDVTEKHRASEIVARAEAKWRLLLQSTSDTVTLVDADGHVRQTTGEFTDILGYEYDWWPGRSGFDVIHPDDLPRAAGVFAELLDHPGETYAEVLRTRHAAGHWELVEYIAVNRLDDPLVESIVITTRNVTDFTQAEAMLADEAKILELIARGAPLPHTLEAIEAMVDYHTGGDSRLFLAENGHEAVRPDRESGWSVPIVATRDESVIGTISVRYVSPRLPADRERATVGVASHLAAIAIERDRNQRALEHQARHDQLTGLPNRWAIVERLDEALVRVGTGSSTAVLLLDLDRFKVVNDSLGHGAGDDLLVAFGERLRGIVGDTAFVGHFGGDEFVVIIDRVQDLDQVLHVASRIDLALTEPFTIQTTLAGSEYELHLSTSIGVALASTGDGAHEVLQHADAAMYRAKDRGRDRLEVFDEGMKTRATELLRVDRDLRLAVERAELSLHYQPKVDLNTGYIIGAEALLRWQHPERGIVLPTEFIGVAEETGLIVRIGAWVLEEAVRQARAWVDRLAIDCLTIAVNISARQLTAPGLVAAVGRVLVRYDWPAEQLTLELTESILIDDGDAAIGVLDELKQLGVRLAIDDFGTGYSSLSYLHRFPVDVVKVDRAFVTPLDADGGGSPVATAVMHMARAFGLIASAEGVEDTSQLAGLRSIGCDWAQGFLFAEALPADEMAALLASRQRW